jgi:hypothetical protein
MAEEKQTPQARRAQTQRNNQAIDGYYAAIAAGMMSSAVGREPDAIAHAAMRVALAMYAHRVEILGEAFEHELSVSVAGT